MDEKTIIQRCIRGDPKAWQVFVDTFGASIYDAARYTLRRVLGRAQGEDIENVYQGVLLGLCDKKFHRLRSFQGRSSFRTWITSVTTRFALNYIRTEKRKGSLKFANLDDNAPDLQDREMLLGAPRDEQELLFQAIERLPARERLLVKLFYFDALPYKQIAEILRMPVNSISPLLSRAKEQIRQFFKKSPRELS